MRQSDDKEARSQSQQTQPTKHWLLTRASKEANKWSGDHSGYFISAQYHSNLEAVESKFNGMVSSEMGAG